MLGEIHMEKNDKNTKTSISPMPPPISLDEASRALLNDRITEIEAHTEKDVLAMVGNIEPGMAVRVRLALEHLDERRGTLLVILDTPGGLVEEVKRIAETLRHLYGTVHFLVPGMAMSAGTVLVMSGDAIYMDYFSCLGPIDPQIPKDGRILPALSYLRQYEALIKKSEGGSLTMAELTLLSKLDLAELHQIQLAAELSQSLIKEWLSTYKFKDWDKTQAEKIQRATEIADKLNDHQRWYTHSLGIHKDVLEKELNLQIDDYSKDRHLKDLVWHYFWPLQEYCIRHGYNSFVHSKRFI